MMESWFHFDDAEEDSSLLRLGAPEPSLLFNKTVPFLLFDKRLDKKTVAFLSGAILFVALNTAYLLMHLTKKVMQKPALTKRPTVPNDSKENQRKDEYYIYDEYDEYYEYTYPDDPR